MAKEKDREPEDLALIYLQVFDTPGGVEVLADLKRTFDGTYYPDEKTDINFVMGQKSVVGHIIDKMRAVSRKRAADVVFKADCIET